MRARHHCCSALDTSELKSNASNDLEGLASWSSRNFAETVHSEKRFATRPGIADVGRIVLKTRFHVRVSPRNPEKCLCEHFGMVGAEERDPQTHAADDVERHPCPRCQAQPGSPCRSRSGGPPVDALLTRPRVHRHARPGRRQRHARTRVRGSRYQVPRLATPTACTVPVGRPTRRSLTRTE